MTEEKTLFSTRDLYLAATLLSLDFELAGLDYQLEGTRSVGYFNFENTKLVLDAEKDYWDSKLVIEPRKFISNMRDLKSRVNSVYKSPHTDTSKFKNII